MAYTKEVPCERCEGTGKVWDYAARDVQMGSNEVPEHTEERECPIYLGQGHVRINKDSGGV